MSAEAALLLVVPCAYGAVSGFNDGGSLLASLTSGRVISPRGAVVMLLLCGVGPLLVGTQVARTVGSSIVDLTDQRRAEFVLITAVSIGVVLCSWRIRIPTSMTLALVGAMVGWVLVDPQNSTIHWSGVARVVVGIPLSVAAGMGLSLVLYRGLRRFLSAIPHGRALKLARFQYLTGALLAIAYGSNDMQKTVGLVVVAELISSGRAVGQFDGSGPVAIALASFIAGAVVGGWQIARRVGSGVFRVRPVQAMSAQLGAGLVVTGLAFAGAPISSTQTISGSLVGVGVGARASAVRWGLVRELLTSWIVTLPLALTSALVLHLLLLMVLGL
jgi:PiT family inorganic phosphate transporter